MNKTYNEYLTDVKSETLDEDKSKKMMWRWHFTVKGKMDDKEQTYNEDGVYVSYRQSKGKPDEQSFISNDWELIDKNIDSLKSILTNDDPESKFILELTDFGKKERETWYANHKS